MAERKSSELPISANSKSEPCSSLRDPPLRCGNWWDRHLACLRLKKRGAPASRGGRVRACDLNLYLSRQPRGCMTFIGNCTLKFLISPELIWIITCVPDESRTGLLATPVPRLTTQPLGSYVLVEPVLSPIALTLASRNMFLPPGMTPQS